MAGVAAIPVVAVAAKYAVPEMDPHMPPPYTGSVADQIGASIKVAKANKTNIMDLYVVEYRSVLTVHAEEIEKRFVQGGKP